MSKYLIIEEEEEVVVVVFFFFLYSLPILLQPAVIL